MNGIKHQLAIGDLFRLSLRIFRTKRIRTVLTILGMAVGIGTIMVLVSLGYGLRSLIVGKLTTTDEALISMKVTAPPGSAIALDRKALAQMKDIPGVAEAVALAEVPAEMAMEKSVGIVSAKIVAPDYFKLAGIVPVAGKMFTERNVGVVVSRQAAKLVNMPTAEEAVDSEVALRIERSGIANATSSEGLGPDIPVRIAGVVDDAGQEPFVFVPERIVPADERNYTEVEVRAKDRASVAAVRDALTTNGYLVSARADVVDSANRAMDIVTAILGVLGFAALVVSAIGVFNAMIVGFLERIYEVGIMKALGATDRDIKNLFLMEALILGISGGIGGVVFGMFGIVAVDAVVGLLVRFWGGVPVSLFVVPGWFVLAAVIFAACIGLAAGWWPAHRSVALSPKEAFKSR